MREAGDVNFEREVNFERGVNVNFSPQMQLKADGLESVARYQPQIKECAKD